MLCSRNTGKYLSSRYAIDRENCAQDKARYTSAEQTFLDVTGQSEGMGNRRTMNETLRLETDPIDPETHEKRNAVDTRLLPGHMKGPGQ